MIKPTVDKDIFIQKALNKYGNFYNYDSIDYINNKSKISIICPIHGVFQQTPSVHLRCTHGCRKCSVNETASKVSTLVKNNRHNLANPTKFDKPKGSRIIPLTKGKYAIIDEEDYDKVSQYNWYYSDSGYARRTTRISEGKVTEYLHKVVIGFGKNQMIDHINHNKLDCRKNNLRLVTPRQNVMNQVHRLNTTSKYKGVSWSKSVKKWASYITIHGCKNNLGHFKNEEDAARAYDTKAKELFGEYAYLNFKEI